MARKRSTKAAAFSRRCRRGFGANRAGCCKYLMVTTTSGLRGGTASSVVFKGACDESGHLTHQDLALQAANQWQSRALCRDQLARVAYARPYVSTRDCFAALPAPLQLASATLRTRTPTAHDPHPGGEQLVGTQHLWQAERVWTFYLPLAASSGVQTIDTFMRVLTVTDDSALPVPDTVARVRVR